MQNLFDYQTLALYKRLLLAPRTTLTGIFNRLSQRLWIPGQFVAIDEGTWPCHVSDPSCSWIPEKPHPHCVEYIGATDDMGFMCTMVWDKPHRNQKYTRPITMRELILQFANQMASNLDHSLPDDECPFVFFTDARFSSAKTMVELQGMGFSSVMSCSSKMAPQVLMTWMKQNLEKREWKTVYNSKLQATLTTIRVKENTYVHLLTDWARTTPIKTQCEKKTPPKAKYFVMAPEAQSIYNKYKSSQDICNKAVLSYPRAYQWQNVDQAYVHFFVHALTLQAWLWCKARSNHHISNLQFRQQVLRGLQTSFGWVLPEQIRSNREICWPIRACTKRKRCSHTGCDEKTPWICHGCNVVLCMNHMTEFHLS